MVRTGAAFIVVALALGVDNRETVSLLLALSGLALAGFGLVRDSRTYAAADAPAQPRRIIVCHLVLAVGTLTEVLLVGDDPVHWAAGAAVFAAWFAGLSHWSRRLPLPL
jgi:hypothetical protein